MKKFKMTVLFFILILFNRGALASELFRPYRSGRADFDVTVDYFKTTSNFISDGSKTDLLSGTYFQIINTTIGGRYVLLQDWGVTTGLNVGSSESSDALATRKNSTLNKAFIGTDYQIFNTHFWSLVADLSYSYAVEKIDPTADNTLSSDGADEVKGILTTALDFDGLVPFGQVGVDYRMQGLSTLLLYSGGIELRFDDIKFGGLLTGQATLKNDDNTDKPFLRDVVTGRVNAGSRKFDSINPTLLDSEIYLKYNFDSNFSLKTFGGYTVIGTNNAVGFHVGAAVNWGFGGESSNSKSSSSGKVKQMKRSLPQNKISIDPNDKSFTEDTNDGVNQDYFKPVTTGQDQYIEQIEGSQNSLNNATQPDVPPATNPAEKDYKIKLKKLKKPSSP